MKKINNWITGVIATVVLVVFFSSCTPSYVASRPAYPVYARPAAPSSRHIWVNDNWVYRGGSYQYQHGYWTLPRTNRVWIDGNWRQRGNRYYWTPGGWKSSRRR